MRAISHVRTISLTRMHRQIFIRMNIELCRFHPNSNVLKNERICCTYTSMILALASLAHFSSTLFIPLSPQSHSVYFSSSLPFRLLLDIASIYRHSFVQLGLDGPHIKSHRWTRKHRNHISKAGHETPDQTLNRDS